MPSKTAKSFRAALEPLRSSLGWTIARVPFDIAKAWPVRKRLRVRGEINGFAFRTSLFPFSDGSGHFLLVNKKMQSAADVARGQIAKFTLEPDLEERIPLLPAELKKLLATDKALQRWYAQLSENMRKEIGKWITEPKSDVTRRRRAEQMAERMMLTMEGEQEPPPILQLAFRRQPLARTGWERMTENQRRRNLLAIFYYQSPEARERRTAKVVEEALRIAKS